MAAVAPGPEAQLPPPAEPPGVTPRSVQDALNTRLAGFLVWALPVRRRLPGSEKGPFAAESSPPGLSTVRFEE
jgi:hypothetical protein